MILKFKALNKRHLNFMTTTKAPAEYIFRYI